MSFSWFTLCLVDKQTPWCKEKIYHFTSYSYTVVEDAVVL
jgi:hypothetical protein